MINKQLRINIQKIPYILRKGHSFNSRLFIVKGLESNAKNNQYRIIVSKKLEKSAVKRNKIRRRIYESLRINHHSTTQKPNLSLIFIPKKSITYKNFQEIDQEIAGILNQKDQIIHSHAKHQ